jgi:hypothetical protein
MSTQYRLVQSGKTASGGCSAGPRFVRAVAPRIIIIIIIIIFKIWNNMYLVRNKYLALRLITVEGKDVKFGVDYLICVYKTCFICLKLQACHVALTQLNL